MLYDLSVVIPAYNESAGIDKLITVINNYIKTIDFSVQFVFVDDGSVDDTVERLQSAKIIGAAKKIVKLSRNYGAHPAIYAGISQADGEKTFVYAADMPEPIQDISIFYENLFNGYEIVYSERIGYKGGLGSRIFARLVTRFIEKTYPQNGLFCVGFGQKVKTEIIENSGADSSIFFHIFGLGFKKIGIPVEFHNREFGSSKWSFAKKTILFVDSFVQYSYAPIRLITALGLLLFSVSIIWALAVLIIKVFGIFDLAAGWPTLFIILFFGFGVTNLSLGVIAEYIVRTLMVSKKTKSFIIEDVYEYD